MTLFFIQHFLWDAFVLYSPALSQRVNVATLHQMIGAQIALSVVLAALLLLGWSQRQKNPDAGFYQYLVLGFFALALTTQFYFVGALSFSAGLFLLAAPVWGLILLDRKPVWWSTVASLIALCALGYGAAYGQLPYAPLVIPPTDQAGQLFWTNTIFYLNAPFFIFILLMADQMLSWWHAREDKIRELSRTDMLTGIHNRLSILDFLDHEISRTTRLNTALSIVILDLDHFKNVNDTWGHPIGDVVLQKTAQILRKNIRDIDAVGRYGGEEFIIVLPGADQGEAIKIVERCRMILAQTLIAVSFEQNIQVTASFGLVTSEIQAAPHLLIKTADEALYSAKHNGRNRVETRVVSETFTQAMT